MFEIILFLCAIIFHQKLETELSVVGHAARYNKKHDILIYAELFRYYIHSDPDSIISTDQTTVYFK